MIVLKKYTGLLVIASVLCLAGCLSGVPDEGEVVFSYTADELTTVFNTDTKTLTMNKWFSTLFSWMNTDYDKWLQQGNSGLFKDKALTQKFQSSDPVKADTVIYSGSSLNGQGPKIGTVTGTIKLTDIPSEKVKIYLSASGKNGKNWSSNGTVTGPIEQNKDMNWSFPVYDKQVNSWGTWGFEPSEAGFTLLILSETAQNGYKVTVPAKTINSADENIGSLGTVSIKGVQLSGTINVTYNGEPVPYIEIYARWDVQGTLETTYLVSPGKDAPWSILLEKSTTERDITFQIFGATKQDYTVGDIIIDDYGKKDDTRYTVIVTTNDVQNIKFDDIGR